MSDGAVSFADPACHACGPGVWDPGSPQGTGEPSGRRSRTLRRHSAPCSLPGWRQQAGAQILKPGAPDWGCSVLMPDNLNISQKRVKELRIQMHITMDLQRCKLQHKE